MLLLTQMRRCLKKKREKQKTGKKKTYDFSQGGGGHVSDRCHAGGRGDAEQGLDALIGDKEGGGWNQAEPLGLEPISQDRSD